MSICNLCMLNLIKLQAKRDGKMVTVDVGNNVYVHPPTITIRQLPDQDRDEYFAAWLMEMPDSCCCGHVRTIDERR